MDQLRIEGGRCLSGEIAVSGAKNSALPVIAASLLVKGDMTVGHLPHLYDVTSMLELLGCMGVGITLNDDMSVTFNNATLSSYEAPEELVRSMRASILVLGPLLGRYGEAVVALPGGCAIGSRPIDLHLRSMQAMGAKIDEKDGYIYAHCDGRLQGASITLDTITVTGTENIMMAAVLAEGTTVINNAAREPEVADLATCLIKMGAHIKGIGSDTLVIEGVKELKGGRFDVLPDRIEAGTFLVAAAATGGSIKLRDIQPKLLESVLIKLKQAGAVIECGENWISLDMQKKRPNAVDITTGSYPDFPTDMQAQFMVLNALAVGDSVMTETVFENRFMHIEELQKMGTDIRVVGNQAFISGKKLLNPAVVKATDLRASASLVIAALATAGLSEVQHIYHIDRGYECIEEKLQLLGSCIKRIPT